MSLYEVSSGNNPPDDFNCIVEIPMRGEPVKYEVDKDSGAVFVDRFLEVSMVYPCNYGYIPHTLADDGDPVDVLVPTPVPLIPGSVVRCRPIGILCMEDEAGLDGKVLAIPHQKLYKPYAHITGPEDLSQSLLNRITHFFEHYKDLEEGKWVKVTGWQGPEAARDEIRSGLERFRNTPDKPHF